MSTLKPIAKVVDRDFPFIAAYATMRKRWALAELEATESRESASDARRPGVFHEGDEIVFTAKFLLVTNSGFDIAKVFTVQACACELCSTGRFVCTTEWLAEDAAFRHLNRASIRHRGVWTDDLPPITPPLPIPRVPGLRRARKYRRPG